MADCVGECKIDESREINVRAVTLPLLLLTIDDVDDDDDDGYSGIVLQHRDFLPLKIASH